jgi:hypothetical protein
MAKDFTEWRDELRARGVEPTPEMIRSRVVPIAPKIQFPREESPNPEADRDESLFLELAARYQSALCSFAQFCVLDIKPRAPILGDWFKEADLGFIYGQRGAGKTWLTDLLISHLSAGRDIDEDWKAHGQIVTVLLDGEMPFDQTRGRLSGLAADPSFLHILHHEVLFERHGLSMNLTDPRVQKIVTELCEKTQAKLLVLDTLSSLFRGMKESDSDAWELVLNWLLDLRRRRIAVLIVHHAGRDPDHMRGTSRREDDAFWVISVKEITDREPGTRGARFETEFTKWRNLDCPPLTRRWSFVTESDGTVTYKCDEMSFDEKVLTAIVEGEQTATKIAERLKADKGNVSRAAARLEERKLIEKRGNGNRTTYEPRGFLRNKTDSKNG